MDADQPQLAASSGDWLRLGLVAITISAVVMPYPFAAIAAPALVLGAHLHLEGGTSKLAVPSRPIEV